jgi:hypothetical protein
MVKFRRIRRVADEETLIFFLSAGVVYIVYVYTTQWYVKGRRGNFRNKFVKIQDQMSAFQAQIAEGYLSW